MKFKSLIVLIACNWIQLGTTLPSVKKQLSALENIKQNTHVSGLHETFSIQSCPEEVRKTFEDYLEEVLREFNVRFDSAVIECGSKCTSLTFEGSSGGHVAMCKGGGKKMYYFAS